MVDFVPSNLEIKVTLDGLRPPIWRRLIVAGDATLLHLHLAIQVAMGWENYHLHCFRIDGVRYGPVTAELERAKGVYAWANVSIQEGKNREVKRLMESLGLKVARLIRVQFGPFHLGQLRDGQVEEVTPRVWREALGMGKKGRA